MGKEIIYIVNTNLESGVREQEIIKRTNSYYWTSETNRNAIISRYYIVFSDKNEAINSLKRLIKNKILSMQSNLEYYQEKLDKVTKQYENEN